MLPEESMRPEVWHALSVHFPIALLPVATITMLISFFIKGNNRHWQVAAALLLLAGCLMAWVAVYTGGVADGIVARKICDPTVLKDHEISAQTMTWIFTSAFVVNIAFFTNIVRAPWRKLLVYLTFLLMLIGTGYLVYTGRIGATLVYEQGAGVKDHAVDCSEYE